MSDKYSLLERELHYLRDRDADVLAEDVQRVIDLVLNTITIIADDCVLPMKLVKKIDLDRLETGIITIEMQDGTSHVASEFNAYRIAIDHASKALEGKRLRWVKYAWLIHNWVGHPLLQLLALCGLYRQAMWVHDITSPKPLGFNKTSSLVT
jgi:hypothetical protein